MKIWTIIIMVLLILVIGVFVVLTFVTESSNQKKQQANILYPFSANLAPPDGTWTVNLSSNNPGTQSTPEEGLYLVGMAGGNQNNTPQIQCPAGYKINIVGAFLDITDPYGECSNTPDPTLNMTCGDGKDLSSSPSCSSNDPNACGAGMTCYSGKCVPMSCQSHSDCAAYTAGQSASACPTNLGETCTTSAECGSGLACLNGMCLVDPGAGPCMACIDPSTGDPVSGSPGFCASMPTCTGVTYGLNKTCSPSFGDTYKCRPRDATAYLSAYCDGKTECLGGPSDMWLPNVSGGIFGPLPCQIPALSTSAEYSSLPIVAGWGGGTPNQSQSGASDPATFNQGYVIHGIYTCLPDDENGLTS